MRTIWPDLAARRRVPELMDDPSLEAGEHRGALAGLRRLNRVSGAVSALWKDVRAVARRTKELRVLDVATGSGDVAIGLAKRARAAGMRLDVHATDISEVALACARERAASEGVSLTLDRVDVIREAIPGEYDVVCCSLFMHHLSEEEAVGLLYRMRSAARRVVVVSDLERTRTAAVLAFVGSRVLTRSRVVRTDAMLSVAAAFTIGEFAAVATEAGLTGGRFRRHVPARFVFTWRRPA